MTRLRKMMLDELERRNYSQNTGACVDIGMILSRILEQEGFWNYIVKGSLTIDFPPTSGIRERYFWSFDVVERPFAAAHAWIVAPPFAVVDISIKQRQHRT